MDHIIVEGLKIYAYHGVFEEEKKEGQFFLITVDMETDTRRAGSTDDLNYSTHYGLVSELIQKVVTEKSYDLIETVAEKCAASVLYEFPFVQKITVKVSKPEAPIKVPFDDVSVTIARGWHTVYLSYGSNMGEKQKQIEDALLKMQANKNIRKIRISSLYETKPYGGVEQDDFLNGACELQTVYSPEELLDYLHVLESEADRKREIHWGPRTLDLDILFYDNLVMESKDLTIPHPDLHNREFVLKPLSELTHYYIHPVFHRSVVELFEALNTSK